MAEHDLVAKFDDQPVSFERPPVNEVYIAVQTKGRAFPGADFGTLVGIFGTQFPKLNAHPKLDRMVEPLPNAGVSVQLQMISDLGHRFWLISQDDTRVLQLQEDRLILNWRRQSEGEYPRYRTIRVEFEDVLEKLIAALNIDKEDLVDFCEVSYTNHIELPDRADPRTQLQRVFRNVHYVDLALPKVIAEEGAFSLTYMVLDAEDQFQGRMRITTSPAMLQKEKRPILQMQLSFRGRPSNASPDTALKFCDRGHVAIVKAFERITTPEMHTFWGRNEPF